MAIRYDTKLNKEINRTIKNFNQKIARLEKTQRDLILPEKITKSKIKGSVYTRTELQRKLKELQRYSLRGAEETLTTTGGVKISRYELTNLKKESARIKRSLTREINKLKVSSPTIFGQKTVSTYAQMGDAYLSNLETRRKALEKGDITFLSGEQLKQYKQLLLKTSKNKQYYNNVFKDNYLKMLTDLGYFYGYDNEKLSELKQKILTLNSENFLKLFRTEKSIQAILDYYPETEIKPESGLNYEYIKEDVVNLYDALTENIDDILKDYK